MFLCIFAQQSDAKDGLEDTGLQDTGLQDTGPQAGQVSYRDTGTMLTPSITRITLTSNNANYQTRYLFMAKMALGKTKHLGKRRPRYNSTNEKFFGRMLFGFVQVPVGGIYGT